MRNSNPHGSNGFKILYAFLGISLILLAPAVNARASSYQEKSYYAKAGPHPFSRNVGYLDLLDLFEYTFDVNGTQIFPNETVKQQIVSPDNNSTTTHVYNLTKLRYSLAGFDINASRVTIHVNSTKIDSNHTRLDLDIYADKATVKGNDNLQQYDRSFDKVTLRSLYGIYDKTTDRMTVHIPYLALLPFLD